MTKSEQRHTLLAGPHDLKRVAGVRRGSIAVLRYAIWFGLLTGLIELGFLLALKWVRDPSPLFFRMNRHAVWMIPMADTLIGVVIGLPLAMVARFRPYLGSRLAAWLLSFLVFLSLLMTYQRLSVSASLVLSCGLGYRLSRRIVRNEQRFAVLVRRSLPVLGLATLILVGSSFYADVIVGRGNAAAVPCPSPTAPNVLLIVLDTLRADRLSLYGYERPTTPNLERLSRLGIRFSQVRSTAPWTLPSHASIMTGRWPHELSARMNGPLDATYPTLAAFLASKGYTTGGFVANLTYTGAETGLSRGFSHYEDHDLSPLGVLRCCAVGGGVIWPVIALARQIHHPDQWLYRKNAEEVGGQFVDWLARQPTDRPFFAFMNFFDVHNPYIPPREFRRRFGDPPDSRSDRLLLVDWFIRDKKALSSRQRQLVTDAYDDCVSYLDKQLGRLFDELARRGHLQNTLVIITADHGEHLGEHALYGHASSLYDQEIRVPLLIIPPRAASQGRKVDEPVTLRDVAATVVDLAGLGPLAPFPGKSLARFWTRSAQPADPQPDAILSEVDEPANAAPNQGRSPVFRGAMKALTAKGMVYIRNGDGVEELYNLESDPDELHDIAGTHNALAILEDFRASLRRLFPDGPNRERSR